MKFYESKTAKFLAGKGFYIVLAVCMAVIGVAAYSAMESASPGTVQEESGGNRESSEVIPSVPVDPPEESNLPVTYEEPESSDAAEIDAEGQVPYFTQPISGTVSKPFSNTALQYSETFKDMRLHTGADIIPDMATVVVSAYSGNVKSVEENTVYGTVITIDHGNGVVLKYCGVKNVTVQKNDVVDAGEIIAEIGTVANECADKEHLHLELILNGEYADPMTLFMEE